MFIIVTSDIHGNVSCIEELIRKYPKFDYWLDAGDSNLPAHNLINYQIVTVRGNTDWNSDFEDQITFNIEDTKILVLHGHNQHVKQGYSILYNKGKIEKADIVIFGHTHDPYLENIDGITYLNPGSLKSNEYAIIDNWEIKLCKIR